MSIHECAFEQCPIFTEMARLEHRELSFELYQTIRAICAYRILGEGEHSTDDDGFPNDICTLDYNRHPERQTLQQIADATGLHRSRVYTISARGMEKLRRVMTRGTDDDGR